MGKHPTCSDISMKTGNNIEIVGIFADKLFKMTAILLQHF